MKWFKHMSDMAQDVKVKRLIRTHGAEGYALYNYVLELICRKLDADSPLPDLEESAADVASDLKMDAVKVEEIMWFCIEQGLFSQHEVTGRVIAHKIYKFLDTKQTRNAELREMIQKYRDEVSPTVPDCPRLSPTVGTRREENRIEEKRKDGGAPPSSSHASSRYENLCERYGKGVVDDYIERVKDYEASTGKKYKDYAAAASNWIKRDKVPARQTGGTVKSFDDKRREVFGE